MFRTIVDDGLEIRQVEWSDADAVFAGVVRNREYLRQWLPWVDRTHSTDEVRQFISRASAQVEAGLGPNAGIWFHGVLVGAVGCHPIDRANRSCSLGYWLEAGHQGKGIVTRCCRKLMEYLFQEVALHRVEIRCGSGNARSRAIPRRLGFTREGLLREAQWVNDRWVDLEVWSMLEREWRQAE
jgi:ribosomal-protein-serine acetyltransferase